MKKENSPLPENDVCHAGQIAHFMIVYLWTLQEKTLDKIIVLYSVHKSNLSIPVNIYRELVSIIECRQ